MSNKERLIDALKEAGMVAAFMTMALYIPLPVIIVGLKFTNQQLSPSNAEVHSDNL